MTEQIASCASPDSWIASPSSPMPRVLNVREASASKWQLCAIINNSPQGTQSAQLPGIVHLEHCRRFTLQEPNELRPGDSKGMGGSCLIMVSGFELIEGLGQEGGKIVMLRADLDPSRLASRLPKQTGGGGYRDVARHAQFHRQSFAKPE